MKTVAVKDVIEYMTKNNKPTHPNAIEVLSTLPAGARIPVGATELQEFVAHFRGTYTTFPMTVYQAVQEVRANEKQNSGK